MGRNLIAQIAKYISSQKRRKVGYWVLFGLSAVVVFCTTYALILPAITISNELRCGMEAHTHSELCWTFETAEPELELICEDWKDADVVFHQHDGFCYDRAGQLICPLEEQKAHVHGEQCYIEERELICGQEETGDAPAPDESVEPVPEAVLEVQPQTRPHVHTDECYTLEQGALACGQEEFEGHVHGEFCYVMNSTGEYVFVCGQVETEDGHQHDETCMAPKQYPVLICEQEETEGHAHSDDCYEWESVLTCDKTEDPVPVQSRPAPAAQEAEEPEEPHVHTDECYESTQLLVCQEEDAVLHTHGPECYEIVHVDDGQGGLEEREVLSCELPVVIEHQHTEACVRTVASEDKEVMVRTCGLAVHVHTDECYVDMGPEPDPHVCGLAEHQHGEECWFESGELRCTIPEHTHTEECLDPDNFPDPVYPLVPGGNPEYICGLTEHTHTDRCRGESWMSCLREEHLHGDTCWLNGELACVQEEHVHTDVCWQEGGFTCGLEEHEHTETCWNEDDDPTIEDEDDLYLRDEDGNLILDEDGNPILKDGLLEAEEPEDLPQAAFLPAGGRVPEDCTEQFDYADPDGGFAVTVFAPEEALPEGAELVARLLPEGSAGYEEAASALDEDSYDGMVALDIHFEVEGWGEFEPFEPVYVVINVMGVLPADADPDSIVIRHHEETGNSGVMTLALMDETEDENASDVNVVVVADSSEGIGAVEVSDDDVAAAFEVASFSYFTIVYKGSGNVAPVPLYINIETREKRHLLGIWTVNLDKELQVEPNTKIELGNILTNPNIDLGTVEKDGILYSANANKATSVGYKAYGYTDDESFSSWKEFSAVMWTGTEWVGVKDNDEKVTLKKYIDKNYPVEGYHMCIPYEVVEPQLTFFYVVSPEVGEFSADSGNLSGNWFYFGSGEIRKGWSRGYASSDPAAYSEYNPNDVRTPPKFPETINIHRTKYYNADLVDTGGYHPEVAKDCDGGFYRVEWVRFVESLSSTHGGEWSGDAQGTTSPYINPDSEYKEGTFGPGNLVGHYVWHVDGYLILGEQVQVKYYVLDENLRPAPLDGVNQDDGYCNYWEVHRKTDTAKELTFTYEDSDRYGSGSFDDWYTDPECTKKWDFTTPVGDGPLVANVLKLYHKLGPCKLTLEKVTPAKVDMRGTPQSAGNSGWSCLSGSTFELCKQSTDGNGGYSYTQVCTLEPTVKDDSLRAIDTCELAYNVVYRLVETAAPAGYNQLTKPIYFKSTDGQSIVLCDENGGIINNNNDVAVNGLTIIVANYGGYKLPETGGPGAFMYTLGGALLCIAAGSLLYSKKSKRKGADDRG